MAFEEILARYDAEVNGAVSVILKRYPLGMSRDELQQEARIWLWQQAAYVESWQASSVSAARVQVYTSIKRRLEDAERVFVAERAAEIPASGLAGVNDHGAEETVSDVLDRVSGEHWQDAADHGAEARFPDSGDLGYYHYRCMMAEVGKLRDVDRELLTEYYLQHRTMQSMADQRGITQGSVSNRLSRIVSQVSSRAFEAVEEHKQAHPWPAMGKLESGWLPGSFGGRA